MIDTLFYTCASGRYLRFIPLYVASTLHHVERAVVEIIVPDLAEAEATNADALAYIRKTFGEDRLLIRQTDWTGILPHTVRFVTPPQTQLPFTYITDVDLIILDRAIVEKHLEFMTKTGLPYSNSVRPHTDHVRTHFRLSGLHFTKTDALWPTPDISDLNIAATNDEKVLYQIVARKGHALQDKEWYRPMPGMHTTQSAPMLPGEKLNPHGTPAHWAVERNRKYFTRFAKTDIFRDLVPLLSEKSREEITALNAHYDANPAVTV